MPAEIVAVTELSVGIVAMVKVAEVAPPGTVTFAGGTAAELSEDRLKVKPPDGAGPERVIVPIDELPPTTVVGLIVRLAGTSVEIVRFAFAVVPPAVAEMVAVVVLATPNVEIGNVAVVEPAGTVTLADGAALWVFEVSETVSPPIGAGPVMVTVPVEEVPPTTEFGEITRPIGTGGLIDNAAVTDAFPIEALMVAEVTEATADVKIVKVAELEPVGTVTLVGGDALLEDEESDTTMPPEGARPLRVTVPVEVEPPIKVLGVTVRLVGKADETVNVADTAVLPTVAVIVAFAGVCTAVVVIVNEADVAPAGTVTLEGGVAPALFVESVTTIPLEEAGPLRVTVPVDGVPPTTEVGETMRLTGIAGLTVNDAVADVPCAVAVIVIADDVDTDNVVIGKEAVVAPAATETDAGTTAV